jgi:molybdate transport system substrate-binding protein
MDTMKTLFALLTCWLLWLPAQAAPLPQLLIAAASDLAYCTDELAAAFHAEAPGAELKFSTGSSGNFFAQIRNGAPFDVFLSADTGYPAQLSRLGAADGKTLAIYAIGQLALWTLDDRVDLAHGLSVLRAPGRGRLAIANPATAPYGRAARALLERDGLWDALQPRLVIGENIAQAAQFVQSGNAQLGMVSLSLPSSPGTARTTRWRRASCAFWPRRRRARSSNGTASRCRESRPHDGLVLACGLSARAVGRGLAHAAPGAGILAGAAGDRRAAG